MPNTYTLISSNVLSSTAASVTFSSIPATFTDLVLRASIRGNGTQTPDVGVLNINSNGASNFSSTYLRGTGSAANSARDTAAATASGRKIPTRPEAAARTAAMTAGQTSSRRRASSSLIISPSGEQHQVEGGCGWFRLRCRRHRNRRPQTPAH